MFTEATPFPFWIFIVCGIAIVILFIILFVLLYCVSFIILNISYYKLLIFCSNYLVLEPLSSLTSSSKLKIYNYTLNSYGCWIMLAICKYDLRLSHTYLTYNMQIWSDMCWAKMPQLVAYFLFIGLKREVITRDYTVTPTIHRKLRSS